MDTQKDFSPKIDEAPDAPESTQHVLDTRTGEIVNTPSSAIPGLVSSGQFKLPQAGQQYVLDKDGSLQQVPNATYAEALQSGEYLPASDEDVRKEMYQQKYGNSELEAAGAAALRGVTMGISDLFLSKIVGKGRLAGLQEANPISSTVGEVAGTIGGLFLPVGPIAKVAGVGAKATEIAAKAGLRALEKAGVKSTVAASIVSKVGAVAAGSAVEGAAFGAGHLLSEASLGKADFNAENLAAEAGTGALFGAGIGGIFGAIHAAAPTVSSKVGSLFKDVDYLKKTKNVEDFMGLTPSKVAKNAKIDPKMSEKMVDALADESKIGMKLMDSDATVLQKTEAFKERAGQTIGKSLDDIEAAGSATDGIFPKAKEVYSDLNKTLNSMKKEFELAEGITAPEHKAISEEITRFKDVYKRLEADAAKTGESLKASKLQEMRQSLDEAAKWDIVKNTDPAKIAIAKQLRYVLRKEIDATADRAGAVLGKDIGAQLKQANQDYYIASKMVEPMQKKVSTGSSIGLKDILTGVGGEMLGTGIGASFVAAKKLLQSDFKHKAVILGQLERANMSVSKAIDNSTAKFFAEKSSKVAKPLMIKSLVDFGLSKDLDGKAPKTNSQAFSNLQTNLQNLSSSPEKVLKASHHNTNAVSQGAPDTAAALSLVGQNAVQFLASKIPKRQSYPGIVPRPWQPSSMELHKFERYVGAVENPKNAIENFSHGRMSREEAEALQVVYPNIFTRLRENVVSNIKLHGQHMPYQKKMQMGILLNMVTDPSMAAENILSLQSNFTKPPEQGSGIVTPSVKGIQNMHFGDNMDLDKDSED